MNAKEITVDNLKLNVLIYGKSGTGKTSFACCFPKPYVFDFDNGMLSQRGRDVEFDTYDSYQEFEMKFAELERECVYDTIVLDSITTMQEYLMDKILAANRRAMPTMNEWNVAIASLKDLFMRMTKIAKHTVVIAHEQVLQDEITGEMLVRPVIFGKKLPPQLPLFFDEMYRTQVSRTKDAKPSYDVLTASDIKYTAKTRLGCLEPVFSWSRDGKMLNAFDIIMGKLGGGKSE